MQLFYKENIEEEFLLDKNESKHLIKVLRKKINDKVFFTDGKGFFYTCIISTDDINNCRIKISEKEYKEKNNYYLHIVISPTKNNDRFEWFLEKSVEMGVNEITPIICENSERKKIKIERLENIIISAMKQSLNFHKPKLNNIIKFKDFIEKKNEGNKLIAYCKEKNNKIKDIIKPSENYIILIGPEGDFSKEEIDLSKKNNFKNISLGGNRLRTETAGIYCSGVLNFINQ